MFIQNYGIFSQVGDTIPSRNITGGIVTTSGNYTIHTFTGSSNLVVTSLGNTTSFDVLMVGGGSGGNGAYSNDGGITFMAGYASYPGGGGGILTGTTTISTGTYPIVIGKGGDGGIGSTSTALTYGKDGTSTTFSVYTAYPGARTNQTTQTSQGSLTGWTSNYGTIRYSAITGTNLPYAGVGDGQTNGAGSYGYGGGGGTGGYSGPERNGKKGGSGIVIIRYLT